MAIMIEIYQYFNEFVSLCTYVDTWCTIFLQDIKCEIFEGYNHSWCLCHVDIMKLYSGHENDKIL
jgi:hypothetical protein